MIKKISYATVVAIILIIIGTFYFHNIEKWSYTDSFYFTTITLTTIGYGDLTPTTAASKIFTSFYAIFGVGIMIYLLSSVIGTFIFRQEERFKNIFSSFKKLKHHEKEIKQLKKKIQK